MNLPPAPTAGYIARFWSPLAATWIMMSLEGPLPAALIARLPGATRRVAAGTLCRLGAMTGTALVLFLFSDLPGLALACALGQALFAFDPLFGYWFETVSGLTPELAAYAAVPVLLLVPLPALSVWLSYQRSVNVLRRRTRPITVATILEIAGIAVIFAVAGWGLDLVGVTAASIAFLGGRLLSNLYLEARGESSRRNRERSRAWTARRP